MSHRQERVMGMLSVDDKIGQKSREGLFDLRSEASGIQRRGNVVPRKTITVGILTSSLPQQ